MADIKLFVSCHRPFSVPEHPLLAPIQVGTSLSGTRFPGFLHDDGGENISAQNPSYCELTAQYWAWKNARADYYGFFHYRRYLYPDPGAKRPYRIEGAPTPELLDRLGYGRFPDLIGRYDLILPKGEDMHLPVRAHYAGAPFHHGEDLELTEALIRERCPEYVPAMEEYLGGTVCYFGNLFIARQAVFEDYCGWLFPLLAEFDRRGRRPGGPGGPRSPGAAGGRLPCRAAAGRLGHPPPGAAAAGAAPGPLHRRPEGAAKKAAAQRPAPPREPAAERGKKGGEVSRFGTGIGHHPGP